MSEKDDVLQARRLRRLGLIAAVIILLAAIVSSSWVLFVALATPYVGDDSVGYLLMISLFAGALVGSLATIVAIPLVAWNQSRKNPGRVPLSVAEHEAYRAKIGRRGDASPDRRQEKRHPFTATVATLSKKRR